MIDGWDMSCEIVLIWMSLDFIDDQSTLVQVMAWCHQATSHYLSQCWPRSLSPYGVTRPEWVKERPVDSSPSNGHQGDIALFILSSDWVYKPQRRKERECTPEWPQGLPPGTSLVPLPVGAKLTPVSVSGPVLVPMGHSVMVHKAYPADPKAFQGRDFFSCKTAVNPVCWQWSYYSLARSHRDKVDTLRLRQKWLTFCKWHLQIHFWLNIFAFWFKFPEDCS